MEREVQTPEVGNISLKDHIRKKRESGTAVCLLCKCDVVYKSRGWKAIESHVQNSKHVNKLKDAKENLRIPGNTFY